MLNVKKTVPKKFLAYTFKCLPIYKSFGVEYTYSVDEIDVPAGYTKTVNGYNIINTAKPGSINIGGIKTWVDNHNAEDTRPPDITVNLLQNSKVLTPKNIAKPPVGEDTSNFSFDNVPLFDSEGTPFVYAVDEEPVEDYKKSINGYNITNTLE